MKHSRTLAACILWLANQMYAEPASNPSDADSAGLGDSLAIAVGRAVDTSAETGPRDSLARTRVPWDNVRFSGFINNRYDNHTYAKHPAWMGPDAQGSNLEGRLGLQASVAANAYLHASARITFASGFAGAFLNQKASVHPRSVDIPGVGEAQDTVVADESRFPSAQGSDREGVGVFEDIAAEADMQSSQGDGRLRTGTLLWIDASPLTLWNRDPRPRTAWYHEVFDPEESSALHYEKLIFSGLAPAERPTWTKKPFGGAELNLVRPSAGLELQLAYTDAGTLAPTRTDWPLDARGAETPSTATSAELGSVYSARAEITSESGKYAGGVNMVWVDLSRELINQRLFSGSSAQGFVYQFKGGQAPYFVDPRVFSLDASAKPAPDFSFFGELGFSLDDSVLYQPVADVHNVTIQPQIYDGRSAVEHGQGSLQPAAYAKLESVLLMPFTAEFFFASRKFWSPYGMTENGASLRREEMRLGAGTFGYQSNLAGINLRFSPDIPDGFIHFGIGEHAQVSPSRDVLQFQQILNGRDVWSASTAGARAGPTQMLDDVVPFGNPRYENRLGDLGPSRDMLYGGQRRGGLRGEGGELWEEFAAYATKSGADSGRVPIHRKFATTLSLDVGVRIDPWFSGLLPAMLGFYGETDAIGTDLGALGNTQSTLLWSGLARCEPAFFLTSRFVLLGLVGIETWKARLAWRNSLYNQAVMGEYDNVNYYEPLSPLSPESQNAVPKVDAVAAPIDYVQMSYGLGCDWDFSVHASLNARIKYATHSDAEIASNGWTGFFLSAGAKLWF